MNMRKGDPLSLETNLVMEFHISLKARDLYQFDDSLFSLSGNVVFLNFHAARVFAHKMNERRDLVSFPERAVKAGQINAMGLIDEILHCAENILQLFVEVSLRTKVVEQVHGGDYSAISLSGSYF